VAASYGIDIENDYTKLEQTVALQGTCYRPTPALSVVALFTILAQWNDFVGPLIYLGDEMK